jgi:hypothetical protein
VLSLAEPMVLGAARCRKSGENSVVATTRFGLVGAPPMRKSGVPAACATHGAPNGTNLKLADKTMPYEQSAITLACYLCNTHSKTDKTPPFEAVPLLRVHGPSVIVMKRRRGASRGRPVFRWFA